MLVNGNFRVGRLNDSAVLTLCDDKNIRLSKVVGNPIYLSVLDNYGFLYSSEDFLDIVKIVEVEGTIRKFYIISETKKRIFCAQPLGANQSSPCEPSRLHASDWEYFDLIPSTKLQGEFQFNQVSSLLALFKQHNLVEVFKFIFDGDFYLKASFLKKIIEQMSVAELKEIAQYFYDNRNMLLTLKELVSGDLCFKASLEQQLSENWSEKHYTLLPMELDYIADAARWYHDIEIPPHSATDRSDFDKNPWMALNYYIRQCVKPSKKFCVVATAKNEGVYLLEWIAYYKAMGADAIFIYSNDNADGSTELLKKLAEQKIIYFIENELGVGVSAQEKAYTHALTISRQILDYEWSLFIDIDEFVVLNEELYATFSEFLNWHDRKAVHAIALNWVFSKGEAGGYNEWMTKSITKRVMRFETQLNPCIKTVFKPHYFYSSQPHFPRAHKSVSPIFRASNGDIHSSLNNSLPLHLKLAGSDFPREDEVVILHYFHKSVPEYIWKYSRNRGDYASFVEEGQFSEAAIQFLGEYTSSIEAQEFHVRDVNLGKHSSAMDLVSDWLESAEIKSAYLNILDVTQARFNRIEPLFWSYIEKYPSDLVEHFKYHYKPKSI